MDTFSAWKIPLNKETFALVPLIEEVACNARLLSNKHKIIQLDCEGIVLHVDRKKIGQDLIILLRNAIIFTRGLVNNDWLY